MANRAPWTEDEKLSLLAAISRAGGADTVELLSRSIAQANISPRWNDIPLPPGRSLNSCKEAFQEVSRQYALSYASAPPATMAYPPTAPPPTIIYDFPARRQTMGESSSFGRAIQPRPPSFAPPAPGRQSYPPSPMGEPSQKKKRGRPTKQEQEQRAADAAARGEPYPPPKRHRSERPQSLNIEPSSFPERRESAPLNVMGTPVAPQPDTPSESSSGRRRRGRPSNAELAARRQAGEGSIGEASPSATGPSYDYERGGPLLQQQPSPALGAPATAPEQPRPTGIRIGGLIQETQQPPRTSTPPSRSFKETVGM